MTELEGCQYTLGICQKLNEEYKERIDKLENALRELGGMNMPSCPAIKRIVNRALGWEGDDV